MVHSEGFALVNVLVISFDPVLRTRQNLQLHQYMNWFDLAAQIKAKDLCEIWLWGAPCMSWDELHWKTPGDQVPYPTASATTGGSTS